MSALGALRRVCRVPRVRPEQEHGLAAFVSIMILLYAYFTAGPYASAAPQRDDTWRFRHRTVTFVETVLVLWNLWRAALTDPGKVPEDWEPSPGEELHLGATFCRRCDVWKLPRTHHCSHCSRCVVRYDHHCDWIDNCVGKRNHKFFVLFLWYVTVCCFHYFYMLWAYAWPRDVTPAPPGPVAKAEKLGKVVGDGLGSALFVILVVMYSVLAAGLLLFACTFSVWTTHQLITNQTTYEVDYVPGRPYDRGILRNVQEVLGKNPLWWLVPVIAEPDAEPRRDLHL